MYKTIILLALVALSSALPKVPTKASPQHVTTARHTPMGPEVPAFRNTSDVANKTSSAAACGTPSEFYVRGFWTWTPYLNNTSHAPHLYFDFSDPTTGIETNCFQDPSHGRSWSSEWTPCDNPNVMFWWSGKVSREIRIHQWFTPCNPWFKSSRAGILAVVRNIHLEHWPDNRWGPGEYGRTPSGDVKAYFNQSTISTGSSTGGHGATDAGKAKHGIW